MGRQLFGGRDPDKAFGLEVHQFVADLDQLGERPPERRRRRPRQTTHRFAQFIPFQGQFREALILRGVLDQPRGKIKWSAVRRFPREIDRGVDEGLQPAHGQHGAGQRFIHRVRLGVLDQRFGGVQVDVGHVRQFKHFEPAVMAAHLRPGDPPPGLVRFPHGEIERTRLQAQPPKVPGEGLDIFRLAADRHSQCERLMIRAPAAGLVGLPGFARAGRDGPQRYSGYAGGLSLGLDHSDDAFGLGQNLRILQTLTDL